MSKPLTYLGLSIGIFVAFYACSGGYQYWDVSKFNIQKEALQDGEPIRLLYSSQGPDNNSKREYFIHLVAVSQKSGDTINILTTTESDLEQKDGDKVFNYLDTSNIAAKLIEANATGKDITGDPTTIPAYDYSKIKRVIRNPKFDIIADNKFATVIGYIGVLIPPGETPAN